MADKLSNFDLIQTNYKHIGDHGIRADILIPKSSSYTGQRPVIIRFHGGGLITGDSLFLDWIPFWLLELAEKHNAIIISPNYRLLPEATSLELFDDIDDFWSWLHSSTVKELLASQSTPINLDLDRILTAGDSAGGLLSICLALAHPDEIRGATASYPCVDMGWEHSPKEILPFGHSFSADAANEHLAQIKPGDVISSANLPDRLPLMLSAIQNRILCQFYERDVATASDPRRELRYPFERLEQVGARIPQGGIAIIHGAQDSVVPAVGSEVFVKRAREVFKGQPGGEKIMLTLKEGDHGFDAEGQVHLEGWLSETIGGAVESWLS